MRGQLLAKLILKLKSLKSCQRGSSNWPAENDVENNTNEIPVYSFSGIWSVLISFRVKFDLGLNTLSLAAILD